MDLPFGSPLKNHSIASKKLVFPALFCPTNTLKLLQLNSVFLIERKFSIETLDIFIFP